MVQCGLYDCPNTPTRRISYGMLGGPRVTRHVETLCPEHAKELFRKLEPLCGAGKAYWSESPVEASSPPECDPDVVAFYAKLMMVCDKWCKLYQPIINDFRVQERPDRGPGIFFVRFSAYDYERKVFFREFESFNTHFLLKDFGDGPDLDDHLEFSVFRLVDFLFHQADEAVRKCRSRSRYARGVLTRKRREYLGSDDSC